MPGGGRLLVALCLGGLLAASAPTGASRQSPDSAEPDVAGLTEQLKSAEQLLGSFKGLEALPVFERVLAGALARRHEALEAGARTGIGEVLLYKTDYAGARDHGARALAIYQQLDVANGLARASFLLSVAEDYLGRRAESRSHAERAVAAYESLDEPRARALATMQLLRVKPLPEVEERVLFERVLADARRAGDRSIEGRALHSQGDGLFNANRYAEALEVLLLAESAFAATPDIAALGTVYNSIGRVYRAHGRNDEALTYQLRALALHEKNGAPFTTLQSLNAVATVYQRLGDLQNAGRYFERALALAEKSSSQRVQDLVRANYAGLLMQQGQFARGAAALEQVIANGLDAYPSLRYSNLSWAYRKLSRPRDALQAAEGAVERCGDSENACVTALTYRAAAHTVLGNADAALTDVNAALAEIEAIRTRLVPTDFFKQDFHLVSQEVYTQAIALQVAEKQERRALETAELARARAFLDLLASRDVEVKAGDRARLAALQTSVTDAPTRIELRASASPTAGWAFRDAGTPTGPPLARPEGQDLELRSFVSATPSATDDLVATAARLNSTLVVYWVSEDEVFIWAVLPDGTVHVRRVPVMQARLRELIRETAPASDRAAPAAGRTIVTRGQTAIPLRSAKPTAWRALYDVLIAPVTDVLPRAAGSLLTIVPQGPLLNVSFASLQSPRGRYLLEDYALHYAPAGAVLQFTAPKKRADARSGPMLVVADPTLPRLTNLDRPLPRLPGARGEATAISQLVPSSRLTVLQDTRATEAAARDAVAGKAVLHFATHAVVSDDDPFGSYLALGPSSGEGRTDGLLTSKEVYGLDLNADLVVLSACRSAGGRVTGDGISAFARAFIYAGTASLVASVWDVADEPTSRLLPDFYRRWLAGASKSRALRDAQLALLRDLRAGRVRVSTPVGEVAIPEHPVFWAGFALFGEPE